MRNIFSETVKYLDIDKVPIKYFKTKINFCSLDFIFGLIK